MFLPVKVYTNQNPYQSYSIPIKVSVKFLTTKSISVKVYTVYISVYTGESPYRSTSKLVKICASQSVYRQRYCPHIYVFLFPGCTRKITKSKFSVDIFKAESREQLLKVQREKDERAVETELVWMSPQSAKIETWRGSGSDSNRECRSVMKKANESLLR